MATTVVFSGGPTGPDIWRRALDGIRADTVVAADGGLAACVGAGLEPDLVVGDMDSADRDLLERVETAGTRIERHPEDKDATDLELALEVAATTEPERLVVVGSAGGRLDHLVAWVGLVGSPRWAASTLDAWMGPTLVQPVHPGRPRTIEGTVGETLSVVALHGPVTGLCLTGVRWPLDDARLDPGSTFGVSNRMTEPTIGVAVATGVASVVRPHPE
jgi:thiamine pyrophosphokinase